MRRREFITLGGAAATWPLAVRAQQGDRMRRIGVLMPLTADFGPHRIGIAAFQQVLQQLGWTDGQNVRIDIRWGAGNADLIRKYAAELVGLAPDVMVGAGSQAAGPLFQATRIVPIVFVSIPDPVAAGFVESLARPGGNATGFALDQYALSGKLVEVLKEIAPHLKRVAVLRDPNIAAGAGQVGAIQTAAASLGVEITPVNGVDAGDIERAVTALSRSPNGGLIVLQSAFVAVHRRLTITLAGQHKLPAIDTVRDFVVAGGLIAYGADLVAQYRLAAGYVDRILKGAKPADLPVQNPTKFDLFINLKTAKALGLDVPPMLLARADEVVE